MRDARMEDGYWGFWGRNGRRLLQGFSVQVQITRNQARRETGKWLTGEFNE